MVIEPGGLCEGWTDATSLTLLEKARANDGVAWERLVSLYGPLIVYWCRSQGLQDADVADLRQNVLVAAYGGLATFQRNPMPGSFRAWLKKITFNEIAGAGRRQQRRLKAFGGNDALELLAQVPARDAGATPDPDDNVELAILYRRALELIATDFHERTWKAFWRVVIDNQRPCDVAGELGMTENAVSLAYPRVLARLRETLGAHFNPCDGEDHATSMPR